MSILSGTLHVALDTTVREANPNTNFDRYAYFSVSNPGVSNEIRTLLTPPRPNAVGLAANKVLAAVLKLTQRGSGTATHTLTIRLLTAAFAETSVTWTTKPGVRTGAGAMTADITGVSDGTVHEIDLSVLFENAANNGWPYYGIQISTNQTTAISFYSEKDAGGRGATIEYEFTAEPSRPTSLHPAAARSETKPRFLASTAGLDVTSQQIQVSSSSDFSSPIRDNTISSLAQQAIDYSPGVEFTALTSDATYYWRCRYTTPDGLTSAWSAGTAFSIKSKPTIALTSVVDAETNDITPIISWTYSAGEGGIQSQYRVIIAEWNPAINDFISPSYNRTTGKWQYGWESKVVSSAATSLTVPDAVLRTGRKYRLRLYIWDSVTRDDERSDRAYQLDETQWLLNVDAATASILTLAVTQEVQYPQPSAKVGSPPVAHIVWTRGSAPDRFRILRRLPGDAMWTTLRDAPAVDLAAEFGAGYEYYDCAPGGVETEYKVMAIVGTKPSQQTSYNPYFQLDTSKWNLGVDVTAVAAMQVLGDAGATGGKLLNVAISNGGTEVWHVELDQILPAATSGKIYPVAIRIRSREVTRDVRVALRRSDSPYTEYAGETFSVGASWVTKEWNWTLGESVTPQIILFLGADTGDVDIDYFYAEVAPIGSLTPTTLGWWLISEDMVRMIPIVFRLDNASFDWDEPGKDVLHPLGGMFVVTRSPKLARRGKFSFVLDEGDSAYLAQLRFLCENSVVCWLSSYHGELIKVVVANVSQSSEKVPVRHYERISLEVVEVLDV